MLYELLSRRTFIIAEAGVNHNGDFASAVKLIDLAARCGAGAVKFQTFKTENLVLPGTKKAAYQDQACGAGEDQFSMIKRLELEPADFHRLKEHAGEKGIMFISTPADEDSVDLLEDVGVPFYKVSSADLTNVFLLKKIAGTGKDVVISTGMSGLAEVEAAIDLLRRHGAGEVAVLHCTTAYPAPLEEVNLSAMVTLKNAFGLPVGFSDHTTGYISACGAVALGARILEKHFTLDRSLPGPDHKASASPEEMAEYVRAVRSLEKAMGDGKKTVTPTEAGNRPVARKVVVARRDIAKGQLVTGEDLAMKRGTGGFGPEVLDFVIGKRADQDLKKDQIIHPGFFGS